MREDTIEALLSAACLLQLSAVVQACCSYLMKQLHPSNCLGIRSFADAQGCQDLHKVAHNYTMVHTHTHCKHSHTHTAYTHIHSQSTYTFMRMHSEHAGSFTETDTHR